MSGGIGLAEALRVLRACGHDLDAEQVLDVLWLARRLPAGPDAPLSRGLRPAEEPPPPPPTAPAGHETPPRSAPPPHGEDLPDLTSSSLYASARRPPAPARPEPRPARQTEPRSAMPVRVPEGKALTDELGLGRALRPLRRRQASRRRREIDEERTAVELAETRLPDVVLRPVQERWLHLVLLVDDGLSMLLWHRLGAELRVLLERLGAFATTRVLGLDTRSAGEPRLHARPFQPDSTPVPTTTVNDPTGRTLVLVVSDGMGRAWRHGALYALLHSWAARGPVALLHTLPQEMWEASGIHAERWQATTRRIGGANTSWRITDPVLPPDLARFADVPVPVLEPSARALGDWARLLASPGTTVELPLLSRPTRHAAVTAARDLQSAQHFRDAATPEAYRLAAHLAAVSPLSVPVMRLVQSAVPWPATTSHLAEVFLGGLVRPAPAPVPGPLPAKHLVFDFTEESKAVLLDAVPQAELLGTSRSIGRRLEQLAGNSPDFPAWLAHPDGSAELPGSHRPFTSVERRLLARLGVSTVRRDRGAGPSGPAQPSDPGDDWGQLTDADPRRIGPYELRGRRRGRRTVAYLGVAERANGSRQWAVVRTPRPDLPAANARLIEVEARVLERLGGQYAPKPLGTGLDDSPPWLAMAPIADEGGVRRQPPRLAELLTAAAEDGSAPFDLLTGLLVGWHLSSALSVCHLNGLVLCDLSADGVFVLRRTVVLGNLSDCVVDGRYEGTGSAPTVKDNMRSLGELLQLISSRVGVNTPGLPDGMHLWQGDGWESLRLLVLRCFDPLPAARPAAGEIADVLARYISLARAVRDSSPSRVPIRLAPRVPLRPPPAEPVPAETVSPLRLPRFGTARRDSEALLERLRVPLGQGRRLTLLGAHAGTGRTVTTVVLGSLLATVRGEPVLALDGPPTERALNRYLRDRERAATRDIALLPPDTPYAGIRALTTRLDSGLEVAGYGARADLNPAHAQEYARVLTLADPYYAFVLTNCLPSRADRPAEAVLDLTDQLILCCTASEASLADARHLLRRLPDRSRGLMRDVVVVVGGPANASRRLPADFPQRLGVDAERVVRIPSDPALRNSGFDGLGRLRPATTRAYLKLAELVTDPATR
ncbi:SAV_2336 N-terminal domain-related protein [Streptomyces sp. NPDC002962]|uniref:SAV_2336 N-terminal domain-related protein n=1 Tax=Streptomyces sp. NPDC002962 TaxID=3364674 RepID=UPI0036CEA81F